MDFTLASHVMENINVKHEALGWFISLQQSIFNIIKPYRFFFLCFVHPSNTFSFYSSKDK